MKSLSLSQAVGVSVLSVGLAIAPWALTGVAQSPASSPRRPARTSQATPATLSPLDRQFITEAAQGGLAEVSLGQLAAQKGTTNTIKQYGQKMVQEHTQANNQLTQIAKRKGITPPTDLGKYEAVRDRLSQLSGAAFDRAYVAEGGLNGHLESLAVYNRQAELGQDPDLKKLAAQTLPIVQRHFQEASRLPSGATSQP